MIKNWKKTNKNNQYIYQRLFIHFKLDCSTFERYKCSFFEHMKNDLDEFNVLRKIQSNPDSTQRELAKDLGFSLGKLNYCLKALHSKGLVKIENFKKKEKKLSYIKKYILTPKGIDFRINLTIQFMKRKMKEYDELKSEIEEKN